MHTWVVVQNYTGIENFLIRSWIFQFLPLFGDSREIHIGG